MIREEVIEFNQVILSIASQPEESFSYGELKDAAEQMVLLYKHAMHTQAEFAATIKRIRTNIATIMNDEPYKMQLRLQNLDKAITEAIEKVRGNKGRIIIA